MDASKVPNTGIWLTMSSPGKKMQRTSEFQRPCVEQTVGQTTGWSCPKVNLKIAPKRHPQGKKVFKKLDMSRLKHKPTAEVLHSDLDKKLENLNLGDALVEDDWTAFKDIVYSTAFEHLGPSKWHNQDWFDENDVEINSLIVRKNCLQRWLQIDPTQPQRKQLLPISTRKCKACSIRCGTSGLAKRQVKFRAMLISMTQTFLQGTAMCLWSSVIWILTAPQCRWNQAHHWSK